VPPLVEGLGDYHPVRWRLPNGLRVLAEAVPGSAIAAVELYVEAGQRVEEKPGAAYLAGRLREEGTARRPADQLAEEVEDVGGALDLYSKGGSLHVRAEDLGLALDVLADVARRPAFPADALGWVRKRIASELRADLDDPAFRADALFRRLVYGDHPFARDPRGNLGQIAALSLDDVKRHHRRYFRPDNSILVVVGDFDPAELRRRVLASFGGWKAPARPLVLPEIAAPPEPRGVARRVDYAGEQVHLILGHLGIPRRHPDYDALAVLDHILGSGPGFTDRLSATLRDELGLAYTVGGGITDSADLEPGTFRVYVGTSPEMVDLAAAAALEQIEAMHRGAFADEEVEQAKQYLRGSCLFDFQGVSQRADRLVELAAFGLPLLEPLRWPARLDRITPDKVRRAARRHLRPDALLRVALGPMRRVVKGSRTECA
jgi:zinc protease